MSIFSLGRKPKRFHHVPIFYDERTDHLREIERRARKEVAAHEASGSKAADKQAGSQPAPHTFQPEDLRGAFSQGSPRLQRRQKHKNSWTANIGMLVLIILILLMVWYWLLK